MTEPKQQNVETVIRKMEANRDQALWEVLHFKCQKCHRIRPIQEAVGVEFPPGNGGARCEIWCESCFTKRAH